MEVDDIRNAGHYEPEHLTEAPLHRPYADEELAVLP